MSASLGRDFEVTKASASLVHREGNLDLGGTMSYSLADDRFGAELSAGYRKDDLRIGAVVGRDEVRGNYAGVGLKWNF